MFFNHDNDWMVFVLLFAGIAWLMYMATFRTRDFMDLMKADQERKKAQAERIGRAAKFGVSVAKRFIKK